MGGAAGFIWVMVVILALAWALVQTGTVRVGVDFNLWVNILLGLAVLGAIFNLFVIPFLGRRTTTTTAADARGSATPTAAPVAPVTTAPPGTPVAGQPVVGQPIAGQPVVGQPAAGAASQEVVQETRDRPSF